MLYETCHYSLIFSVLFFLWYFGTVICRDLSFVGELFRVVRVVFWMDLLATSDDFGSSSLGVGETESYRLVRFFRALSGAMRVLVIGGTSDAPRRAIFQLVWGVFHGIVVSFFVGWGYVAIVVCLMRYFRYNDSILTFRYVSYLLRVARILANDDVKGTSYVLPIRTSRMILRLPRGIRRFEEGSKRR